MMPNKVLIVGNADDIELANKVSESLSSIGKDSGIILLSHSIDDAILQASLYLASNNGNNVTSAILLPKKNESFYDAPSISNFIKDELKEVDKKVKLLATEALAYNEGYSGNSRAERRKAERDKVKMLKRYKNK